MKILGNEIKPGMIIEHKNDLWSVLKAQHVKPGKGGAFNQVELKSVKKRIIGVTCHNSKKLALKASKQGANYVAFGSFFESSTKKSAFKANLAILRWAKKKINMPTVAIGGINSSNYKKILSNGADFIACSSYVWNNKKLDPVSAIKNLNKQ